MTTRPKFGHTGRGTRPGRRGARWTPLVAGIAAVAVAVLGLAGTASASTATVTADAIVTPAATTSACAAPTTFTVAGTVSATGAGTVTYQWTGSPGTSPVKTLHFGGMGTQRVAGPVVRTKTAGTRWAAIKIVSPKAATSNRATYLLKCSRARVTVSAAAAVTPATRKVTCGAARPAATFTGKIYSARAGKVTYYWELPTGNGPARSLTFSAPGAKPAVPATVTAAADSTTETGTLVVLSPAAMASRPATFSVSCTQPPPTRPADFTVNLIANQPTPKTVLCGSKPPGFEVMATFAPHETVQGETYHWVRPNGTTTAAAKLNLTAGSTGSASDVFTPASDTFSGKETLVFTSPVQGSWSIPLALTCTATPPPPPSPPHPYVQIDPPPGYNQLMFGSLGESFYTTMTANYGTRPYTWSATGLPPGLAIDAATGAISGTITALGQYRPRVTVTDSSSPVESYSLGFGFNVSYPPMAASAPPLPDGTVGVAYPGVTFSAIGGDGAYSWYLAGETEPPGLSMSSNGVLSGTPTQAGTFGVDVVVHDGSGEYVEHHLPLVIHPAQ